MNAYLSMSGRLFWNAPNGTSRKKWEINGDVYDFMIYFDLVRSAGGWTELKAIRKTDARIKGDERILDNSDFVVNLLNAANKQLEEKYALKAGGCSIDILIEVNGIEKHKIIDVPIFSPFLPMIDY